MTACRSTLLAALVRGGLLAIVLGGAAGAAQANRYRLVKLESHVSINDFNDRGDILAYRRDKTGYAPILFRRGHWEFLDPGEGQYWVMNEQVDLLGIAQENAIAVWPKGKGRRVISTPEGATQVSPKAISNRRTVLGLDVREGSNQCFVTPWNGLAIELGRMDTEAVECNPSGINDDGWVTGFERYDVGASSEYHAFVWKNGLFTDIGFLADVGPYTAATSINRRGDVVGIAGDEYSEHAFLWNGVTITDIGVSDQFIAAGAESISNRGEIVGYGYQYGYGQRAVRFANGRVVALADEVVDLGSVELIDAYRVNDQGVILCQALRNNTYVDVLLVPEPGR